MGRSRVLHQFTHRGERYRIAEPAMGPRPHLLQREDDGGWFLDHEPDDRLSDEILRLAFDNAVLLKALEEVLEDLDYMHEEGSTDDLRETIRRIRQALHREDEE